MRNHLKQQLATLISEITSLKLGQVIELIEEPKNKDHGDLSFPCFILAKQLKKSPPQCAQELSSKITLPDGFTEITATGPFLNFTFDRCKFTESTLNNCITDDQHKYSDKTVLIEYSSPNIAKPFHVGHLRATLIGNCLDRVYRHLGYHVESINHLGDWGTQFGFVWAGCKLWGRPEEESVAALVNIYKKATNLKEEQEKSKEDEWEIKEDINAMARAYFLDLEEGKDYAVEFWQWCLDISLVYLKNTYKRLDIKFDHYLGESFYSDKLASVEKKLDEANLLTTSQDARGVDLGEELGFARITTPDGRSLYLSRDIAAALYRYDTFKFDKCIYVVGAPQTLHFQQLVEIINRTGSPAGERIEHVPFGMVLGMKTRGQGKFIELNGFLDDARDMAQTAYNEQVKVKPADINIESMSEAVSQAAIIFSNLSKTKLKDVNFSWEHALAFQGDSGPYLLYAYARINGIKNKAKENGIEVKDTINAELITDNSSYNLIRLLASFNEVLQKVTQDNEPSHLAGYALELAKAFSKSYNELKVSGVEQELAEARLKLFDVTQQALGQSLKLLGINPVEKM